MPLISVIMPLFNAEAYLSEAVQSVLNQTVKDLELIVIDDGSTDNSLDILNSICSLSPTGGPMQGEGELCSLSPTGGPMQGEGVHNSIKIKLIRSDHKGPSSARNLGITHATGEFVTFLDADDTFFNDTLESSLQIFQENQDNIPLTPALSPSGGEGELNLVYGGHPLYCNQYMIPYSRSLSRLKSAPHLKSFANQNPVAALFDNIISCQLSSIMVRRSYLLKTGLFNPDLTVGEDFDLFLRLFKDASSKIVLNRFVIKYRANPQSLMHSPRHRLKRIEGTRTVILAIENHHFSQPELNALKKYYASKKWLDLIDKLLSRKNRRLCHALLHHFMKNSSFSSNGLIIHLLKIRLKLFFLQLQK